MCKTVKLFLAGAIVLAGVVACTPKEEINPNYDAKTNSVNADFVFNVSTGMTPQTKQSSANTQATIAEAFRGISDAQLYAFKLGVGNDGKHVATATTADKTYTLGNLLAAGALDPDGTPKSRRVIELALPVETNALMFWGKAPQSGVSPEEAQGQITFSASSADISNHAFSLNRAFPDSKETELRQYQQIILAALNSLSGFRFQAAAGALTWTVISGGDGSTNANDIDIYWSDFVTVDPGSGAISKVTVSPINPLNALSPFGEIFAEAYIALHTIYPGELRAGSGLAVHRMFSDLYQVVHNIATSNPTNYQEFVAKQFAISFQAEILKFIDSSDPALPLQDISTIKTNYSLTANTLATEDIDKFPGGLYHLPTGGLQLLVAYDGGAHPIHTWSYNPTAGGPGGSFAYTQVMYPAELCYFGNSPLRVSDTPHVTNDYPDGSGTGAGEWMNDGSWTADWSIIGKHVLSTTRSVAMAHNINYGTALLKSTIKYGAASLQDNNHTIQQDRNGADEANNTIDATSGGVFELVGILIGGQEQTMGWNYVAKAVSPTFDKVIYDNAIPSTAIPAFGGVSEPNYTLVWDNYNPTLAANAQQMVYVGLELKNTSGKDFWGEKNLVRNGGTFYLIGKLDPTAGGGDVIWPTTYALPPYDGSGNTIQAKRVFIQDYMTTANFVLSETSLQHAYVTVPDLRSTQISLGLSVDLAWSAGLTFDDIELGSN
ncbi:MAG: hypothetical protein J5533_02660 [Bacteroidales bacterium]|nr:hypothetical protein [Bacteroidales bacterium]